MAKSNALVTWLSNMIVDSSNSESTVRCHANQLACISMKDVEMENDSSSDTPLLTPAIISCDITYAKAEIGVEVSNKGLTDDDVDDDAEAMFAVKF
jgi:hypothetical protein